MANIQLADNLRRLRKQYNYTQAQIGKKLHITHQAYSNYETGIREPNLQLLAELSWIYHTSVDSLITQYCNAKNPSSVEVKNYFCIKIENSENDILLTKNEVNLLLKYRSAGEAERKLAHEALDFTEHLFLFQKELNPLTLIIWVQFFFISTFFYADIAFPVYS